MNLLAGEAENINEDDPKQAAQLMRKLTHMTGMELGPGTLYRSIKQLLAKGFIAEIGEASDGSPGAGRQRRSYGLTPEGRVRMAEEAQRLRALVQWADDAMAVEGGRP